MVAVWSVGWLVNNQDSKSRAVWNFGMIASKLETEPMLNGSIAEFAFNEGQGSSHIRQFISDVLLSKVHTGQLHLTDVAID